MKTIKIKDLNEYGKLVDNLAEQIKKSGKVYKAVYSPDNPMLAFLLSKKLGIALWLEFPIQYSFKKEVIVVSDIISTGKTREQYKDFDFACLFQIDKYPSTIYHSTLVGKWLKINTKVIMSWEKEVK